MNKKVSELFNLPVQYDEDTGSFYDRDRILCLTIIANYKKVNMIKHVLNNFDRIKAERDEAVELLGRASGYVRNSRNGMSKKQREFWTTYKGFLDHVSNNDTTVPDNSTCSVTGVKSCNCSKEHIDGQTTCVHDPLNDLDKEK